MSRIVIGIDQSYTRTGITILEDKKILEMHSVNFDGCRTNTEKREHLKQYLESLFDNYNLDNVTVITERIRLRSQGFLSEASGTELKSGPRIRTAVRSSGIRLK